jgi:drug/metabolite transporter (DMT)-like permease
MPAFITDPSIVPPSLSIDDLPAPEVVERLETVLTLPPDTAIDPSLSASSSSLAVSPVEPSPKFSPETLLAFGALAVALVSVALSAVFVKFSEEEINPYATAFNRFWMTTVILLGVAGFKAIRNRWRSAASIAADPVIATQYTPQLIGQLVLAGCFLAADFGLWATAMTQTSIATSTLLSNLTPIFTSLGAWVIWRKAPDRRFLAGMAVAVGCTLLIGLSDLLRVGSGQVGDAIALLGAAAYGGYLLVIEQLRHKVSVFMILLWSSAIAAVITFPIACWTAGAIFPVTLPGWLAVLSLAIICQVIGQGLLAYSLDKLSSGFIAIVLLLDPVLAAFGGWVCFSESITLVDGLCFLGVLVGVAIATSSESSIQEG